MTHAQSQHTQGGSVLARAARVPSFLVAAVTESYKWGDLNNTELLSPNSGGPKSEIKVWAGPGSL